MIETIELKAKSVFSFGSLKSNDVLMAHQSISRNHSQIIVDQELGICLIDLGSKSGTFLGGKRLEPHIPYKITIGDVLMFAVSTRKYLVSFDFSEVEKVINEKKKSLQNNMKVLEKLDRPDINEEILKASLGIQLSIFVNNLPLNVSAKCIAEYFSQYGKVTDVKMPSGEIKTRKVSRFCTVNFSQEKEAKNALNADRTTWRDSKLKVVLDKKKSAEDILNEKMDQVKSEEFKNFEKKTKKALDERFKRRWKSRSKSPKNKGKHSEEKKKKKKDDSNKNKKSRSRSKKKNRNKSKSRSLSKRKNNKNKNDHKNQKKDNYNDKDKEIDKKKKKSHKEKDNEEKEKDRGRDKRKEREKGKERGKEKENRKEREKDRDKEKDKVKKVKNNEVKEEDEFVQKLFENEEELIDNQE